MTTFWVVLVYPNTFCAGFGDRWTPFIFEYSSRWENSRKSQLLLLCTDAARQSFSRGTYRCVPLPIADNMHRRSTDQFPPSSHGCLQFCQISFTLYSDKSDADKRPVCTITSAYSQNEKNILHQTYTYHDGWVLSRGLTTISLDSIRR